MPIHKLIIFDLDGTLLDTVEDLGNAVNHALDQKGFKHHSVKEYRKMIGNGVRNLLVQAIPPLFRLERYIQTCLEVFMDYYVEHICDKTIPYKGIPQLLEDLQKEGVKLAIASNKFQSGTEKLIKTFFPFIRFVKIYGNCDGIPLKPDPKLVENIIGAAYPDEADRPSSHEILMVGDGDTDVKMAINAGIDCIAVTWGYRTKDELKSSGAIKFASSVKELRKMLGFK